MFLATLTPNVVWNICSGLAIHILIIYWRLYSLTKDTASRAVANTTRSIIARRLCFAYGEPQRISRVLRACFRAREGWHVRREGVSRIMLSPTSGMASMSMPDKETFVWNRHRGHIFVTVAEGNARCIKTIFSTRWPYMIARHTRQQEHSAHWTCHSPTKCLTLALRFKEGAWHALFAVCNVQAEPKDRKHASCEWIRKQLGDLPRLDPNTTWTQIAERRVNDVAYANRAAMLRLESDHITIMRLFVARIRFDRHVTRSRGPSLPMLARPYPVEGPLTAQYQVMARIECGPPYEIAELAHNILLGQ